MKILLNLMKLRSVSFWSILVWLCFSNIPIAQACQSYLWRSESGLTQIDNLNQICWGSSNLYSVQTVFGYNRSPFTGTINLASPRRSGCAVGDRLSGTFNLSGNSGNCRGNITITWQSNNNAYIQWNITNLGSSCPVGTANWSINTYPVSN